MKRVFRIQAPAKVNLYLDITGRRADGYHLLETVMQSVSLYDTVTVEYSDCGSGKITVECDRADIPTDERNIAYKAARLFSERSGISGADVKIAIQKRIPTQAGMGGGSTDAAAVIAALAECTGLPRADCLEIAEKAGADVPFCLFGGTAICRGIGEQITRIENMADYAVLVIKPDFSCPTGAAYAKYDASPLKAKGGLEEFIAEMRGGKFGGMYNVFRELYSDERIEKLISELYGAGAKGAMLSGSGSAVFGVFAEESEAEKARARFDGLFTAVCRPCGGLITDERTGL